MIHHAPAFQLAAIQQLLFSSYFSATTFQQLLFSNYFSATNSKTWLKGQAT
jgi:hypothetical protein